MDVESTEHQWYRRKLPVAAAGVLSDSDLERFERHLQECDECRSRWSNYLREDADELDVHLPAGMLARWDSAAPKLGGLERELVLAHLERCVECQEDLRLAGQSISAGAELATTRVARRPRVVNRAWWRGMGVGVGAAALAALLAWTMVVPHGNGPDELSDGVIHWIIPSQLRGGSVQIPSDTRQLALTLSSPVGFDAERSAELEVLAPDGSSILQASIDSAELRRSTIIVLLRSAEPFAPGSYQVRLTQPSVGGQPLHEDSWFELSPVAP